MQQHCRLNQIYHELQKSIRKSLISHTILLDLISANAVNSAYNGIEYTIKQIVETDNGYNMKIDDYACNDHFKTFCITRNNNVFSTKINLMVYKKEAERQIEFVFHIYM